MSQSRSVIGMTYQGQRLALIIFDSSLPRVPEVYGHEPEWVESCPEGQTVEQRKVFIEACRAKHWPARRAS